MCCSSDLLKDYLFGELPNDQRRDTEGHIAACASCQEEFESLRLTKAALRSLPEEEPPRRIAFVSDKVFEPTWWQRIWASGARLGFASAAMLAAAIVAHGYLAKPAITQVVSAPAPVDKTNIQAEVDRRVQVAVEQAVAAAEARQGERILQLIAARQRQNERDIQSRLLSIQEYLVHMKKRNAVFSRANYDHGVAP